VRPGKLLHMVELPTQLSGNGVSQDWLVDIPFEISSADDSTRTLAFVFRDALWI
jgi:hypothetical protein